MIASRSSRLVLYALGLAALIGVVLGYIPPVLAQAYPSRAVKLVVPFAPGGGGDILARPLAERLGKRLGQPVVIENKSGAGGTIGTGEVTRAKPDGYTLMLNTDAIALYPYLYGNLRYDVLKELTAVGFIADSPMVLAVNTALPVNSVRDLVDLAKREPGKLNFANPGQGSPHHLAFELFVRSAGISIGQAIYRGGGPALTDVIAGHAQIGIFTYGIARQFIDAGKLKPLALFTESRSDLAPNLPTMAEAGMPGVHVALRFVVMAPTGTPTEIVAQIQSAMAEVSRDPEFRQVLRQQGYDPFVASPAQSAALLRTEHDRWGPILKAANIRLD